MANNDYHDPFCSESRLMSALKQFETFMNGDKESHTDLVQLFKETYPTILDNYNKICTNEQQLKLLQQSAKETFKCNIAQCAFVRQYYSHETTPKLNDEYEFYRNLMIKMHCYLVHPTFVPTQQNHNKSAELACITSPTYEKRVREKFKASIEVPATKPAMEQISEYMNIDHKLNDESIAKFVKFSTENEFDTEAMEYDITFEPTTSNFNQFDECLHDCLRKYFYHFNCKFSVSCLLI